MIDRPKGLPDHISEENIGELWQSSCSLCDIVRNYGPGMSSDEILGRIREFRRIHNQCDRDEDAPYRMEKECTKCGNTKDRGVWCTPKDDPVVFFTLCCWCEADSDGMREWLGEQIEESLSSSPDQWEKLPDGRWRSKTETNHG